MPHSLVNYQKLRWTILDVFRLLLLTDPSQIPNMDPSIQRSRRQDGRIMRVPADLMYLSFVELERMQFRVQLANIKQTNRLASID